MTKYHLKEDSCIEILKISLTSTILSAFMCVIVFLRSHKSFSFMVPSYHIKVLFPAHREALFQQTSSNEPTVQSPSAVKI